MDGVALVSYADVFKNSPIDADCVYNKSKGTITITKNDKKIVLTINSKKAAVNGKKVNLTVAPIKYKFTANGITKIYIPSKFVAENLGYEYNWSSDKKTLMLDKKTIRVSYNGGKAFEYAGVQGKVTIDGVKVKQGNMPSIIHNDTTLVRAKSVFADSKIKAKYSYNSKTKEITISKGDTVIVMMVGSRTAYVNGTKVTMSAYPIQLTNHDVSTNYIMVPGSFTAKTLGYDYKWNKGKITSEITSKKSAGKDKESTSAFGNTSNNINNGGEFAYKNGWLYTTSRDISMANKERLDSTEKLFLEGLSDIGNLNVTDKYIYYTKKHSDNKLFQSDLEGNNAKVINNNDSIYKFVLYDKYIFYISNGNIYRMNLDGSDRRKLTEDKSCDEINITKDFVFYRNNKYDLIRMNHDGTSQKKLHDYVQNIITDSEYVYFTDENSFINRIKFDGTGLKALNTDKSSRMNVSGNTLYYSNSEDNGKLYGITIDGKARTKLRDESVAWIYIVEDMVICQTYDSSGWVGEYIRMKTVNLAEEHNDPNSRGNTASNIVNGAFTASDGKSIFLADQGELYRLNIDGSEKIQFDNYKVYYGYHSLNAVGDYIYYSLSYPHNSSPKGIYKVRKDGTGVPIHLSGKKADYMTVVGDWIYFTQEPAEGGGYTGSGHILKMRIDGTQEMYIESDSDGYGRALNIVGDYIYYINDTHGSSIYRMKTDGSQDRRLSEDEGLHSMVVYEDYIYYYNYTADMIKRMPVNGGTGTVVVPKGGYGMTIENNRIYYVKSDKIYSCKLDGTDLIMETECYGDVMNITAGYIYYNDKDGYHSLIRMKLVSH